MGQLKTFLVVNPRSGNGATGRQFEKSAAAVRAAIGPFEHSFTTGPMVAARLARDALRAGFECIVAVGGDGTANEVVNGFFDGERPVSERPVLGIIPRGTGGDFRRSFGWTTDLEAAAARLRGEASRPIDAGRIEFCGNDGEPQRRWFLNIASAGVSGRVDWEVNRTTKALGGRVSFLVGTARAMLKHEDVPMRFALDDGPWQQTNATMLAVANGQYFGGGMWVAPEARPDDGLFDVTLWSGYRLRDFVLKGRAIYTGRHVRYPNTRCFKARRVRVESEGEALLDVDGEQPGRLPATFEMVAGAVRLKVDG